MLGPVKRRQVNEVLWQSHADIICLQEHRMDVFEVGLLKLVHSKMDCFTSIRKRGSGGSLILVKADWCAKLAFSHPQGQAAAIQVERQGETWVIISVYAPNSPQERALLWAWLQERIMNQNTFLCGDLNRGDEENSLEWNSLAAELKVVDALSLCGSQSKLQSRMFLRRLFKRFVAALNHKKCTRQMQGNCYLIL